MSDATKEMAEKHRAAWVTPENRALAQRVMYGDPSIDDLFDVAKLELRDALDVSAPFAPDNGRHLDSFHAGCCMSRVMSYIEQIRDKLAARWEELAIAVNPTPTENPYEAARRVASERDAARTALQRIADTDTHGKNVADESGRLRPTGMDFCGRCNRNSFHPHTDDCPIALAVKLVGR